MAIDERPYPCGVMVSNNPYARCSKESDHEGECVFVTSKPAPAPLRDARSVVHSMMRECGLSYDCDSVREHSTVCHVATLSVERDRAARQTDVARLRELLEEGARLVEAFATAIHIEPLEAWARRAREAGK